MSQYLPTGGFRWDVDTAKYTEDYIKQLSDTAARGCMLEVDLEYPQELHDKHDQYPLAPEHVEIKYSMLSEHQKQQARDFGVKPTGFYQKLKTLDPEGRWMDFSNYPPGWCENQKRNKLIPGKFKDEGAGKIF